MGRIVLRAEIDADYTVDRDKDSPEQACERVKTKLVEAMKTESAEVSVSVRAEDR